MIEINLLPGAPGKSKGRMHFNPTALFGSLGTYFTDRYVLGVGVAVIVSISTMIGMFLFQSHQERAVTDREIAAARDSARFAAVLVARAHAETTRDSVYQQLAIIKSIDDSRFVWPHLLEEINLTLPPYTWLTSVVQTSAVNTTAGVEADSAAHARAKADSTAKKETPAMVLRRKRAHTDSLFNGSGVSTTFRIVGQTVDIQALTLFMKNLEASPFIKNVRLTRSDLVTTDNKEVTEFQLEAETEVPPQSMIESVPLSVAVH